MDVIGAIQYTTVKQIGVGQGMNSEVYLADDRQLGGIVAAKEIPKSQFPNVAAYFAEAKAMFAVAHDNVVAVQYACETASKISLVMPYYKRGSLADRIAAGPLTTLEVIRIAQGVLSGLAHIHLKGYIHFDLKPSNVLFSDRDRPMVADFGQSRAISRTGVVRVPGLYVNAQPPETISTGVAGPTADIYHAGLLLYRTVNGNPFYVPQIPADDTELQLNILSGKFPNRKSFMPHVPQRLRSVIRKALRRNPNERFQSAGEMLAALARVDAGPNWQVRALPMNGTQWRVARPERCDLVVELTPQSAAWSVATFTETVAGLRRAKEKAEYWKLGLSRADAFAHLETVFQTISE